MATVNNRLKKPRAITINGVSAGGAMQVNMQIGHDTTLQSSPDGLQVPVKDREVEFCRGSGITQDWTLIVDLLTGTVGTLVFYERNSGVAEATGYTKHTITAPVIYLARFNLTHLGYATCYFAFECRAADETKGFADMWVPLAGQAAPSYITPARGGYRILSCAHGGSLDVYHVTALNFEIAMNLVRACMDGDVGYTCVDAELDGMRAGGSLSFQDTAISASTMIGQKLAAAAAGDLVLNVRQSQGATAKVITIANTIFNNVGHNADVNADFTGITADFEVANDAGTPLTLEGSDKIITIANAA